MVLDYQDSKLSGHGFKFRNWPGPGEQAAEFFSLSHAVIVPAGSDRIIVGGQVGLRDDETVSPNIHEEVNESFEHVQKALQSAGLGEDAWEYVYKLTMYLVPTPGLEEGIGAAISKFLKTGRPATTGINVTSLVHPELHIEISVEAYIPKV